MSELAYRRATFAAHAAHRRESESALDVTRDRHGRTVHHDLAAITLAHRDQAALQAYATYLLP
ncbi:hypothetical protein [Streptomyces deccanensis]|uniref:hypothetical protein n=1 Tax=Streptomyces deccanensis TaxID=424188 RepID=UPI001EFAB389|nr:hypothetical protein [Streptomyces deccanensis]ULR48474.1 hypothetical protein L3078_03840 [Streptomyces deccanensis]